MDSWDLTTLDIEVHKPEVLRSDDGAARAVAVNLPGGDRLQEHENHEHCYLVVVAGEIDVEQDGNVTPGRPGFVAHFAAHERREIRAKSDSRLLMIFAPWPGPGHPGSTS